MEKIFLDPEIYYIENFIEDKDIEILEYIEDEDNI